MAQCISPFFKKETGMSFPCGKCYPCKMRRAWGWAFRMKQEAKRSDSALFVTLTYNTDHVPLTENGYMTLDKRHVQLFFKQLRNFTERESKDPLRKKIKYYAVGEYGDKFQRPHYHAIIFNAEHQFIEKAWTKGDIYYGDLTPASAMYTLKYISKDGMFHHKNDDRAKEFSLMSKKLGDNYLTDEIIQWHRQRDGQNIIPPRYCLFMEGGTKIAMPRYYKQKIWSQLESQIIGNQFIKFQDEQNAKLNHQQILALFKENELLREYFAIKNTESRRTVL